MLKKYLQLDIFHMRYYTHTFSYALLYTYIFPVIQKTLH